MVTLPKSNRNVFVIGPSNQSYTREKCATISQGGSLYNARRKWPVRSSRSAPQVIGSPEDLMFLCGNKWHLNTRVAVLRAFPRESA
jgi:hypothetical protein